MKKTIAEKITAYLARKEGKHAPSAIAKAIRCAAPSVRRSLAVMLAGKQVKGKGGVYWA